MRDKSFKRMVISLIAVLVVAVMVVSVLQFPGITNIFAGGYKNTGLTLNTNTQTFSYNGEHHSELIGRKIIEGVNANVFANTPNTEYVTSWRPNGASEIMVLDGHMNGAGFQTGASTPWWGKYHIAIGEYYWEAYLTTGVGTTQVVGKTFFDDDVIEVTSGSFGEQRFAGKPYALGGWGPAGGYWTFVDCGAQWNTIVWNTFVTQPVSFRLKGPVIGGLEVRLMVEYAELQLNNQWESGTWFDSTKEMQRDNAYLLSGVGDITVENIGFKRITGTETDDFGETYTHYVFEELGTVTVSIDAMYSGDEWTLQLHNSKGQLVKTWGPVDGLHDNVVSWKAHYMIPVGSWIRNDPNDNEWSFTLDNALFQVDKERIFTIDAYANAPGQTSVTTDKPEYTQGDTIHATFTAQNTSDAISYFRCWARYGTTGSDYALTIGNYQVDEVSGSTYRVHISFAANKGAKSLTITGLAVDSAGRTGFEGEKEVYITQAQPVYTVTVHVTDSSSGIALTGVQVKFGNDTKLTANGTISFSVKSGTYEIHLAKASYTSIAKAGIYVNHETELNYQMVFDGSSPEPEGEGTSLSQYLIYIIIGIVVLAGVLYGIMYYRKKKRK